ncbi:Ff.00g100880.m01.CDS01 [Fusarium sp. VM40]|nr:Ff.00g100880.m01.CDS01 [Fusarium sp. VM40]
MEDGGEREANVSPDSVSWKAQYDMSDMTENEGDCTYWFRIVDPRYHATLADSQYFNVSAPKPEETKTIPASTVLITLTAEATTSTTDASSSKEAGFTSETSPKSGLSKGEIAGVAVGATVGGLLVLGVIGWVLWKRRIRMKDDAAPAELPGSYNQDQPYSERPKSELPAEPVVLPSASPRGPPEVYEAP